MRAPYIRHSGNQTTGPDEAADTVTSPVSTEDLIKNSDFHSRLAEARLKRQQALAARSDMSGARAAADPEPHNIVAPGPAVDVAMAVEPAPAPRQPVAAFVPIPSQIELTEDAAARQRLGAAMTLSRMPDQPLEPALVPMVSAATLAGLPLRHMVPATLGLAVVAIAAWMPGRVTQTVETADRSVETAAVASLSEPTDPVSEAALPPTEVAAVQAPKLEAPIVIATDPTPSEPAMRAYSMYDAAQNVPVAVALEAKPNSDAGPAQPVLARFDATDAPALAANGTQRSLRPIVRPSSAVNIVAGGGASAAVAQSAEAVTRSADPLPQVATEPSATIETAFAQAAWQPASPLTAGGSGTALGVPTRKAPEATADHLLIKVLEEPRGLRRLFKGLGPSKRMTAERFKAENAD